MEYRHGYSVIGAAIAGIAAFCVAAYAIAAPPKLEELRERYRLRVNAISIETRARPSLYDSPEFRRGLGEAILSAPIDKDVSDEDKLTGIITGYMEAGKTAVSTAPVLLSVSTMDVETDFAKGLGAAILGAGEGDDTGSWLYSLTSTTPSTFETDFNKGLGAAIIGAPLSTDAADVTSYQTLSSADAMDVETDFAKGLGAAILGAVNHGETTTDSIDDALLYGFQSIDSTDATTVVTDFQQGLKETILSCEETEETSLDELMYR